MRRPVFSQRFALVLSAVFTAIECVSVPLSTSCGQITTEDVSCCLCENGGLNASRTLVTSPNILLGLYPYSGVPKWGQLCSFIYDLQPCIKQKAGVSTCSSDILDDIFNNLLAAAIITSRCDCLSPSNFILSWDFIIKFYSRTCHKDKLNAKIQSLVTDPTFNKTFTCLGNSVFRGTSRCFLDASTDIQDIIDMNESPIGRFYTDILNCVFGVINRGTCNNATRQLAYHIARLSVPPYIETNANEGSTEDVTSSIRCTLGVYGDPHLKTCWGSELVACSAPGEQTYLRNKFIVIKGTNVEVGANISPRATSLKVVTLTFYSFGGENIVAKYTARDGDLPISFDGLKSTVGDGKNNVQITFGQFGRIRFSQKGSGAVLILRQWDGNYFFTLRMADNVLVGSSGLLVDGCPAEQVVTRDQFTDRRRRTVDQNDCETSCRAVFQDEFLEACIIDCIATGDIDFATNMTGAAVADYSIIQDYDEMAIAEAKKDERVEERQNNGGDTGGTASTVVNVLTITIASIACFLLAVF